MGGAASPGPGGERERYPRATLREQLGDEWASFAANRRLQVAIAAVLIVFVGLRILTPQTVAFDDVRAGDCLFIRTAAAQQLVADEPVGGLDEVRASLRGGAERASCDLSHSHEVVLASTRGDEAGTPYPREGPLVDEATPACAAAAEAYLGRPLEGSGYVTIVVVPDEPGWDAGGRTVVCLLQRADGRFMDHRAGAPRA
jgi:hypothetical protein